MLQQYTKEWIINDKTDVEGGYVNNPHDSGGATNHGITQAIACRYAILWPEYDWDGNMATMPIEFAYRVYDEGYWRACKLDWIHKRSQVLADKMFDIAINCGTSVPQKWLQALLNLFNNKEAYYKDIAVDGMIGQQTLNALDTFFAKRGKDGHEVLITGMICRQGEHYLDLATRREKDETFVFGWLANRVRDDIEEYVLYNNKH